MIIRSSCQKQVYFSDRGCNGYNCLIPLWPLCVMTYAEGSAFPFPSCEIKILSPIVKKYKEVSCWWGKILYEGLSSGHESISCKVGSGSTGGVNWTLFVIIMGWSEGLTLKIKNKIFRNSFRYMPFLSYFF